MLTILSDQVTLGEEADSQKQQGLHQHPGNRYLGSNKTYMLPDKQAVPRENLSLSLG